MSKELKFIEDIDFNVNEFGNEIITPLSTNTPSGPMSI